MAFGVAIDGVTHVAGLRCPVTCPGNSSSSEQNCERCQEVPQRDPLFSDWSSPYSSLGNACRASPGSEQHRILVFFTIPLAGSLPTTLRQCFRLLSEFFHFEVNIEWLVDPDGLNVESDVP